MEICKLKDVCGGCSYQGVAYEEQLSRKADFVRRCLHGARLDPKIYIDIKPCPVIQHYRNKMEYTFGSSEPGGPLVLGLHGRGCFMTVFNVDDCLLVPKDFDLLQSAVLTHCRERDYSSYNKKSHEGLLRNLVLRRGVRTDELLVNIITTSYEPFDGPAFRDLVLSLKTKSRVVGVLHTVNDGLADTIACDRMEVLYGDPYYNEIVLGLRFRVGAFSFFQTNVDAAERLYADALSLIPDLDGKTVYDLYCGTGTLTQAMALRARKAIGVEIVEDAVLSARANAQINMLSNCDFLCGDVQFVLDSIKEKPDVIVVDPPRSGISVKALRTILSYGVSQIVYVSCNPKTLAENLRGAVLYGYKPRSVTAYDNFPFTSHVETVCLLTHKG